MRRVKPKHYTKEYYLASCTGYQEFIDSKGTNLEPRLEMITSKTPNINNSQILDIGCGRGELVYWSAYNGASKAIGIDYSESAISLANKARNSWEPMIRRKTEFKKMDAKKLEFKDESFDLVFLIEVLEHLYPEEQVAVLSEIRRILKRDGILVMHTAPSKFFIDYTYKYWCYPVGTILVRLNNLITGNNYTNIEHPNEVRDELDHILHVNEPEYYSLREMFGETGFKGTLSSTNITVSKPNISWKDKIFNFLVYLDPLSHWYPFNVIWGNDFFALLNKT